MEIQLNQNLLMKKIIQRNDCNDGFVLDGFPRTIIQADGLAKLLTELNIKINYV